MNRPSKRYPRLENLPRHRAVLFSSYLSHHQLCLWTDFRAVQKYFLFRDGAGRRGLKRPSRPSYVR